MSNAREIKSRIKSVKDTQKIASAMYLISSTKMQKAKAALDSTRPYFSAVKTEIVRIFDCFPDIDSLYLGSGKKTSSEKVIACLVITADKGLAGAYNQNAIKEAEKLLKENSQTRLFVVGEYGRLYFLRHNIPIEQTFLYTAQNPTIQRAREICRTLLDLYESGTADEIYIIYTDLSRNANQNVQSLKLLPLKRTDFAESENRETQEYEFWPDAKTVLKSTVPAFLTGFIYSALIASFCSEQNARMTAMSAANDNAEEIISKLSLKYNCVRQADITREITEISAGAKAQRRKKKARETKV